MQNPRVINKGDVDAIMEKASNVIEGEVRVGGQEHFYMEPHSCIAVPSGEDGEIMVISSTQNLTLAQVRRQSIVYKVPYTIDSQLLGASAIGVPMNRITARTKRVGLYMYTYIVCTISMY